MPNIEIQLIKNGEDTELEPMIPQATETSVSAGTAVVKLAAVAVIAKQAWDLSKATFERIRRIEIDQRANTELLRQYGGAGFSANTIGDRINIFGRKISGESVAYRK